MKVNEIIEGNCIEVLKSWPDKSVDLVYLDPPFFSQKQHSLSNRDLSKKFEFDDQWDTLTDYLSLIHDCLQECRRVLKDTGNIFLHCDKYASHHLRIVLDKVFGSKFFQSEIIWTYKRWSNSKRGLLNSHQTIFFYSKTANFKFNRIFKEYSPTTNIDQILQERKRNNSGKSTYKRDKDGNVIIGSAKKGVPLSDVWDIPYLNPKAKERVGYPTQKPVLLLRQIIEIATDEEDLVVDPFNGSGTTCVAAKSMNRKFIGIDTSPAAVDLANERLSKMVITDSAVLRNGKDSFLSKSEEEVLLILKSLDATPVQRNAGIDGFLKENLDGFPIPVKVQTDYESLNDAKEKLEHACSKQPFKLKILVQTKTDAFQDRLFSFESNIKVVKSLKLISEEYKSKQTATNTGLSKF